MNTNIFDEKTMRALKQCIVGMKTEETTSEYALDDETGEMRMVKQKRIEKIVPPNPDIIKLIYHKVSGETNYEKLSDEELERERLRLLNQLKENVHDSRESKS